MSLVNQNWTGLHGEPITGRIPPRLLVMNGVQPNPQQLGMIAHHYKLLTYAMQVSVIPFLIQERHLTDGTRIRMVSSYGTDTVMVWPTGGGGDELTFSGIGVCFTALDGTPIDGWSYKDENDEGQPQPYILTPGRKKLPDGTVESTGEWKRRKVSRLVGGQQLWVSKDRKMWLSNFAEPRYQQPEAAATRVGAYSYLPLTIKPEWTAVTKGRFGYYYYSQNNRIFGGSQYICRLNDTVALGTDHYTSCQVSARELTINGETKKFVHAIQPSAGRFIIYRGTYKPKLGLAEEAADLGVPGVYLDFEPEIYLPITTPNLSIYPTTLSVHPDGTKAICMSATLVNNITTEGGYVTLKLDAEPTYTVGDTGLNNVTVTPGGTAGWSVSTTQKPRFWHYVMQSSLCSANGGEYDPFPVTALRPWYAEPQWNSGPQGFVKTTTRRASGAVTYDKTENRLNRYYYAHNGDEIKELTTITTSQSKTFDYLGVRIQDPGEYNSTGDQYDTSDPAKSGPQINSYDVTASLSGKSSTKVTINLGKRIFVVWDHLSTASVMYSQPNNAAMQVTLGANYSRTTRTILFYDHITEFIIYYEQVITVAANGTQTPAMQYGSYDMSTLATASATGRLVGEFKSVQVFTYDIAIPPDKLRKSAGAQGIDWGDPLYGRNREDDAVYSNPPSGFGFFSTLQPTQGEDVVTATNQTVATTGFSSTYCGNGNGERVLVQEADGINNWYDYEESNATWVPQNYGMTVGGEAYADFKDWSQKPERFMHVAYARDPVTLAVIVQLSFSGSKITGGANTDKDWIFAADNTGAKLLRDAIGSAMPALPADATIYREALMNSLVSI